MLCVFACYVEWRVAEMVSVTVAVCCVLLCYVEWRVAEMVSMTVAVCCVCLRVMSSGVLLKWFP